MRRTIWILAALPLAACGGVAMGSSSSGEKIQAGGSGTARTYSVADFTGVELAGFDDVDVRVGPAFSVRAEGAADELDTLDIRKDGPTLKVGRERRSGFNWGKHKSVKVFVTLPRLFDATVAGSGDMKVDRVDGDDFSASIAGSGDLSIGAITGSSADLSIAGSGGLSASGQVQKVRLSIAGSGDIAAAGLKATSADVSIAGSGDVAVDVNGPASVSIMGSGNARMGARAQCKTSKMGSGTVTCG